MIEYNGKKVGLEVEIIGNKFLSIRETLTRIGISSSFERKLFQSCHILQKKDKYYIVHFKEMFILNGKNSTLSDVDKGIRNKITELLRDWGMIKVIDQIEDRKKVNKSELTIVKHGDKANWEFIPKYTIGKKCQ